MARSFIALRATIYGSAFVGLFAALAHLAHRLDGRLGGSLPAGLRPVGPVAMVLGAALGLACVVTFVQRGHGTPAPFDPPRRFVALGPYRIVRNPMYVGGLVLLGGFALHLRSPMALVFTLIAAMAAHVFVVRVEEPGLDARFGESYRAYRREVRRWWPRWPS